MTNSEIPVRDSPAYKLCGLSLSGGWKVVSRHPRPPESTGGKYSVCYDIEREGQKAFLKALDFSRAADEPDLAVALQALTEAFNFEREILNTCAANSMNRVIAPLDAGQARVDESVLGRVPYIIFEQADGDIRQQLAKTERFDQTCKLRALHHIATGLYQLHAAGIAHQDLKPSNVLQFGEISKVSDLGCASVRNKVGPMDGDNCPGSKAYAPPELIYSYLAPEFNTRRFGCDVYLLGSMVMFFFAGISTTAGMLGRLHPELRPQMWHGTFEEILPYLRNAFDLTVQSLATEVRCAPLRRELLVIVRQLCEPDPGLRGHPKNRTGMGNRYSVERYVSAFNLLASKSRLGHWRE
jgi:serine/threonine protein kinase